MTIIAGLMKLEPDTITREKGFERDLGMDSLDFVELILEAEDQFNITISDNDATKLATVGAFVDYIKSQSRKGE